VLPGLVYLLLRSLHGPGTLRYSLLTAYRGKALLTAPRSVQIVDFGKGKTRSAKKLDTRGHHG
jgi:hypothetical protein